MRVARACPWTSKPRSPSPSPSPPGRIKPRQRALRRLASSPTAAAAWRATTEFPRHLSLSLANSSPVGVPSGPRRMPDSSVGGPSLSHEMGSRSRLVRPAALNCGPLPRLVSAMIVGGGPPASSHSLHPSLSAGPGGHESAPSEPCPRGSPPREPCSLDSSGSRDPLHPPPLESATKSPKKRSRL